jgi:hypothetical protein
MPTLRIASDRARAALLRYALRAHNLQRRTVSLFSTVSPYSSPGKITAGQSLHCFAMLRHFALIPLTVLRPIAISVSFRVSVSPIAN